MSAINNHVQSWSTNPCQPLINTLLGATASRIFIQLRVNRDLSRRYFKSATPHFDLKVSRTAQSSTDKSSRKLRFTGARIWKHCLRCVHAGVGKHPKSFSLIDCVSIGVDRMQRNFEPMRKQVEAWQRSELTDVTARLISRSIIH